ncbi:carboxypeptidase-like regulatory domain-containing protein [Parabacteroides sp. AM08-6]|uniref:carboxypeptidase-like regulatory domain-containing protein n=1 Tax=Parabacteroides sp. AM08-6 TaxID=2292053 RepID=UPI000EFE4F89|nr:carboxypeptidase-like regulatory domain-containing protein [Parabacteroides sp. AM08-6]RHJ86580.1 hypothetical protein DW103_02645 [Parabacteroides sp. AM08-6]
MIKSQATPFSYPEEDNPLKNLPLLPQKSYGFQRLLTTCSKKYYNTTLPDTTQNKRIITGIVTCDSGELAIGASVREGTSAFATNGTIAGMDGRYTLSIEDTTKYLTFSYIGYKEQIVKIQHDTVDVEMKTDPDLPKDMIIGSLTRLEEKKQ